MKIFSYILLLLSANIAQAATISYAFTGELDRITDDFGILTGQFSVGDSFSGSFSYITDAPEQSSTLGDPTTAIYKSIIDFEVNINGYIFNGNAPTSPGFLQIWDNRVVGTSVVDAFSATSPLDFTPPISGMGPGNVVASAKVNLFDFTNTASQLGTQIPSAIDLADYGSRSFSALQLNTDTDEVFHLNGVITSLTPVPLPPSALLFLTGLVSLIGFRVKIA